ncbi:MAG: phasin family protein [Robiginitomaculum sp.]|nr:phasin family protein [Robiginitomaculum sp.]
MTDKKNKSGDTARKIWLAGIGAYGRAFSEVQEGLSKATKNTAKVFDELVQKGEVLETVVTHKSKEAFEKVSDKFGDTIGDGFDMDERIAKMRARLKRGSGDGGDVEDRLDAIEAKLDEVLKLLKPKKAAPKKKPAPRKKAAPRKKPIPKK